MFAHVFCVFPPHVQIVDAEYYVALLQSCQVGRHSFVRLVNHGSLQSLVPSYNRTNTGILACDHEFEVFGFFLRIVFGVRVETVEHGLNAVANHLLWVERVDIH